MNKRVVAGIAASIVVLAALPSRAAGQTAPTATPTPTSTPSPTPTSTPPSFPDPYALLVGAFLKMATENSYRLTLSATASTPGAGTDKVVDVIDQSIKPAREHDVLTEKGTTITSAGKTKKIDKRIETYTVGKHMARRAGNGKWKCSTVSQSGSGTGVGTGTGTGVPLSPTDLQSVFENAETVGPATLRGTAAWHVHADLNLNAGSTSTSTSGTPQTVPVDFYVAQSNFLLLRLVLTLDQSIFGVTLNEKVKEDLSRFGEKVQVTLPSACKK